MQRVTLLHSTPPIFFPEKETSLFVFFKKENGPL